MRLLKNGLLWLLSVACAVSAAACTSAGGATQQAGQETAARTSTLFEGARVIVGDGATTIENAAFLVQGNRIASIGRSGEIQAPPGATRVNLTGKTVMPALLDLHSHIGYEDTATNTEDEENFTRENVIDHLERFAYTGHALTHSLGNDNPAVFDARYADDPAKFVDLRVESQQDSFTGARYYTIGRGLAWEGTGNPRSSTPYPIFRPLQARLAVRELHAQGISFAKLWLEDRGGYQIPGQKGPFYLTQESYSAAITEAHRLGMRTIAHVKTLADTKAMIRAGLDIQTHPIQDFPVDAELIALMKGRPDFWVIPVLTPAGVGGSAPRAAGERPVWLRDPLLRAVKCEADLERWGQTFEKNRRVPTSTGNLTGENIAALYKAGVHMALGSHDAGGTRPLGWGSHMELEAFVNWVGMTPHQAIVSATSAAATLLGVDDDLGTLAPGKGADFIVLDANPLDDIRNTRRISDVYLRGKKINREAMAARWKAACGGRAVGTTGQAATEPLSKTYRVTRADDVEFQKVEPFKVFDNLYYVGPGYVSVWLLTTPEGNILFDSAQEPYVDYVINNIRKVGVDPKSIRYIILSHGHLDHFGGAAKIQEASGARVVAAEEDWKMIEQVGSRPGRGGAPPPRVPKRDMVVKDGDSLTLGGQALKFHITPGHTPGVVTTEGITLYDGGKPYRAILWGGGGYRGGLAEAKQSVSSTNKVAQIQGVQVNLQIHSWAEPDGYPRGGVLERGLMLKSRKPGDPHPFVDPATFTLWVKRAQDNAAKAVQEETQKAGR